MGTIIKKIIMLAVVAFVLCSCTAMADTGCPQVPETQGFATSTAMSALGTVTETDSIITQITNDGLLGIPPSLPLGEAFEVIYTGTYSENTIADQGLVTYTKGMTTDTAGAVATNLYNVQTSKVVEFIGTDTGRMTSDESTVIDGAGTPLPDGVILICPFAGGNTHYNPAFCNIVQEGSSVDLTLGSLTTGTAQRYIMAKGTTIGDIDMPVSDPGVELDYTIKLTGFGDVPAMGSAEAYINVHDQEARGYFPLFDGVLGQGESSPNPKAEDLVYSETSTASGDITLFQKVMSYTSRITQPGPEVPVTVVT
jgi:hypothetical protein